VIGIDQHRERRRTRHPPHLLGEFSERDQRDIGVTEHRERGDRAAEHAERKPRSSAMRIEMAS